MSSEQLPLHGLTVIELHAIGPVPFAGMLLQNLGAKVLRVSPPNDPGLGLSIKPEYDVLNLNKTALIADLKTSQGLAQVLEEIKIADVLLEGFRPGVLERLNLSPAQLLTLNPRLVIGRLSGWGDAGELATRAGHDINYLAMSGALHAIGTKDHPIPPLNLVADFGGGAMHLLVGVLSKLVQRGMSKAQAGGVVTTSILAGTHGLMPMFYGLMAAGIHQEQRASNLLDGSMPFYRVYKTADQRHIAVGALEPKFYKELLSVLGLEQTLQASDQYKPSAWSVGTSTMANTIALKTRDQWAALAQGRDCCLSPVLTFSEAGKHPHNLANQWFDQSGQAPFKQPAQIIRFE
jgi:alpha-methylacyl-CoA racemase